MIGHRRLVSGFELPSDDLAVNVVAAAGVANRSIEWAAGDPNGGALTGVVVRAGPKTGAGTVSDLRVVVASKKHLPADWATVADVPAEAILFDETIAAVTHSDTEKTNDPATATFGDKPQPWIDGIVVLLQFTLTGTIAFEWVVALLVQENR